jgi:hypothetical protein
MNPVSLIVRDYVRRSKDELTLGGVFIALMWFFVAVESATVSPALGLTLAAAALAGPFLAFGRMAPREVLLLPVSRRQIWLARMCVASAVATLWAAAAQLAGLVAAMPFRDAFAPKLSIVLLTAACVFLYTGAMMGLLPLLALAPRGRSVLARTTIGLLFTVVTLVFASGIIWPILLRSWLPVEWTNLRGPAGVIVLAAAALTAWSWSFSPPIAPHAAPPVWSRAPAAGRRGTRRTLFDDRLRGVPKLLWWAGARSFINVAALVLVLGCIGWPVAVLMPPVESFTTFMIEFELLPFSAAQPAGDVAILFLLGFFTLEVLDTGLTPPKQDLLRALIRHLRTLPLSTIAVVGIVVGRRILGWLSVWLCLLIVQAATFGPPDTLRLPVFVALAGVDALVHAWKLRWRKTQWEALILAFFVYGALVVSLKGAITLAGPPLVAFGALSLLIAAALLQNALIRHRGIYQPLDAAALAGSWDLRP